MSAVTDSQAETLVSSALAIRERAYAPYSKFFVGAAILTQQGDVFVGCNVENASYGLCICAERSAVTAMVAAGKHEIAAVAVACSRGGSPCGACRQVLAEFGDDFEVIIVDADSAEIKQTLHISDLLPHAFKL